MLQKALFLFSYCSLSFIANAQKTATIAQPAGQPVTQTQFAYKKLNPLLEYAFIVNKPTSPHPKDGDQISINMQSAYNNRLMYSTAVAFKGKPAVYGVAKPAFNGDIIEAILLMTPGDSIVCLADADAVFKNSKNKKPDFFKKGDKIQYFIKLVSIKSKEQLQKEQQAAFMKQMTEQAAKQKVAIAISIVGIIGVS